MRANWTTDRAFGFTIGITIGLLLAIGLAGGALLPFVLAAFALMGGVFAPELPGNGSD